jgi:mannonate dehydratase
MNRRNVIKNLGLGLAGGSMATMGLAGKTMAEYSSSEKYLRATNGLPPVKITNVKAIATQPKRANLVIVKVETDEPGLYGVGCATFTQRAHTVVSAINDYLGPFCKGKIADNIEDLWQIAYQNSYWRNGPVLNNALSGLDQALWDIKGKRAGMPVYDLLGGKCRFAVDTYESCGGGSIEEVVERVQGCKEEGFRYIKIQMGGYGSTALASKQPDFKGAGFGYENDSLMDAQAYLKGTRDMFAAVRKEVGEDIELVHDVHERIQPMDAINLCKDLEQYRPFFIEDPFSPENIGYFKLLREQSSVPIAMGELFNSPHEWVEPMVNKWFDFIRIHISQIGGITPAMKVCRLGEWFNVKTAWHGPSDVSPVGHAANAHIDLAIWNFGIQESPNINEQERAVFPGSPRLENGYLYINEAPGLGIDVDEKEAAKYPISEVDLVNWTQLRKQDGTPVRP